MNNIIVSELKIHYDFILWWFIFKIFSFFALQNQWNLARCWLFLRCYRFGSAWCLPWWYHAEQQNNCNLFR